jgi:alpha-glucosidase
MMIYLLKVISGAGLILGAHGLAVPTPSSTGNVAQYTIPTEATNGQNLIANIDDPEAIDAQTVCPGYKAYDVRQTSSGVFGSLKLAGEPCNVYGIDAEYLTFSFEYQAKDRLNIAITPADIEPDQTSWYILSPKLVPKPEAEEGMCREYSDLVVSWSNEPTFSFKVTRKETGHSLFDTTGTKLVYENQFIEFVTALPDDYNLYGLGERVQGLRLPHNATLTTYAADIGEPLDRYSAQITAIMQRDLLTDTKSQSGICMASTHSTLILVTTKFLPANHTSLLRLTRWMPPRNIGPSPMECFSEMLMAMRSNSSLAV